MQKTFGKSELQSETFLLRDMVGRMGHNERSRALIPRLGSLVTPTQPLAAQLVESDGTPSLNQ